jgi:glycolate oxidase FAD binding subunit
VGVTTAGPETEAALARIVGHAHVADGSAAGARRVDGRAPRWVVAPGTVEEVAACLRLANAEGLAVVPTGHGTRLGWGNPPRALDLVLSVHRLDRILAHEPADLTMTVEAGVSLGMLEEFLRTHRQRVPLDPARAAESTVGGLIATGAAGPYRARYGTMRELLLGLTLVQADGTVVTGGGRVVKNVTGYDVPKLHIGALGTLGIIVTAHLRVHPVPASEATWLLGFASAEAALDAALGLLDAPLGLSRLELVDGATLTRLGGVDVPAAALGVTVGSVREAVHAQGRAVEAIGRRAGGHPVTVAAPEAWWRAVSDATGSEAPEAALVLRVGTRTTDLVKALRAIEATCGPDHPHRATAEVANGVLHPVLAVRGAADAADLVRRTRETLAPLHATCVVEHAPVEAKAALDVWGDIGPALSVMRELKAELDPRGILNPGRYVGGI